LQVYSLAVHAFSTSWNLGPSFTDIPL